MIFLVVKRLLVSITASLVPILILDFETHSACAIIFFNESLHRHVFCSKWMRGQISALLAILQCSRQCDISSMEISTPVWMMRSRQGLLVLSEAKINSIFDSINIMNSSCGQMLCLLWSLGWMGRSYYKSIGNGGVKGGFNKSDKIDCGW